MSDAFARVGIRVGEVGEWGLQDKLPLGLIAVVVTYQETNVFQILAVKVNELYEKLFQRTRKSVEGNILRLVVCAQGNKQDVRTRMRFDEFRTLSAPRECLFP